MQFQKVPVEWRWFDRVSLYIAATHGHMEVDQEAEQTESCCLTMVFKDPAPVIRLDYRVSINTHWEQGV